MKTLLLLLAILPLPAFASDTVEGFMKAGNESSGPVLTLADGSDLSLGVHFMGGSVCGAYFRHFREITAAVGHHVRLTGLAETTTLGNETFLVDLGGVEILP